MLLDMIIEKGLAEAKTLPDTDFRIHKIVPGASHSTAMGKAGGVFQNLFPCTVYLEHAYGFAYAEQAVRSDEIFSVLNQDVRDVLSARTDLSPALRVALADALYCALRTEVPNQYFSGTLPEKARDRARAILSEIPNGTHLALLGPVTEIITEAHARYMKVLVTDRSDQKVGQVFGGEEVKGAAPLRSLLKEQPSITHVIATGMIFATDTADEVFAAVREKGIKLTLFMETGARFAPALLDHGAHHIVAEEFPFYDFCLPNAYCIFTNNANEST